MTGTDAVGSPTLDLAACAREPIHTPGSIQPHGHLLALRGPDLVLVQANAGAQAVLTRDLDACWGEPLEQVLASEGSAGLLRGLRHSVPERGPVQLGMARVGQHACYQTIAHKSGDLCVLELEELPASREARTLEELYPLLQAALARLQSARTVEHLATVAAAEVRRLTGFDRVMVYRFDADWNGTVVAEDRNDRLPSYLDLRFPASDIPEQARRLYTLNRLRLIADVDYRPVPILTGAAGEPPLDLTFSVLRSVSPVHVAYMRNMGTPASMSISLVHHDRLWGLISCHPAEPHQVPFAVRTACDLVGQVLSIQTAALQDSTEAQRRVQLGAVADRLLTHIAKTGDVTVGLSARSTDLLGLADADGAAIVFGETCSRVGRTPSEGDVRHLAAWLEARGGGDVFACASLAAEWPEAERWKDTASGVLAISISKLHAAYVLWFRPEVVETVAWGGDPRKPVEVDERDGGRLHPRRSFEAWKEIVRLRAIPWHPSEVEAARDLRNAIVGIVLRRAEEMAALNQELERSNRELAAFSYSVSHDLRAPFRHIVGYSELLREMIADTLDETGRRFLGTIIESAESAGKLVDSLLAFSQLGRTALTKIDVDLNTILEEVRRSQAPDWRPAGSPGGWTRSPP